MVATKGQFLLRLRDFQDEERVFVSAQALLRFLDEGNRVFNVGVLATARDGDLRVFERVEAVV